MIPRMISGLWILVNCVLLARTTLLTAQQPTDDGAVHIIFHVTSVTRSVLEDMCTTGECTATRFKVEGYSLVAKDVHATEFVLQCQEVIPINPIDEKSSIKVLGCNRVRANAEYCANLFADVLFFSSCNGPIQEGTQAFDILSQREINGPKHARSARK